MRKFYLQNSIGERIDLNDTNKYIMTSPSGLGLQFMVNQFDISNGFYKRTKIDTPAVQIMGDITFTSMTPYKDYRELVNWLNAGYDLSVVYCPYGADEYYCDVNVESIGKTEINSGHSMTCTMVLIGRTPWYKPIATVINIAPDSAEKSTWDWEWDVVWANDHTSGETEVKSGGHLPSAITVSLDGALYNPKILLLKNGSTVAQMVLDDTTIAAGSVLSYSSLYTNAGVWVDGVSQLPKLDLANENFFRIPLGDGYSIRLTSEQSVPITGSIAIYDYFRSV